MTFQRRRIVVADDHHDAADTTAELLRINAGYEVKVAYDGREAVEVAHSFHPEVVILDINMPVMDGYQAARLLRDEQATNKRLLLVALTGYSQPDDAQRSSAAGFDHHLRKPLMDMKLFEMIESFFHSANDSNAEVIAQPTSASLSARGNLTVNTVSTSDATVTVP